MRTEYCGPDLVFVALQSDECYTPLPDIQAGGGLIISLVGRIAKVDDGARQRATQDGGQSRRQHQAKGGLHPVRSGPVGLGMCCYVETEGGETEICQIPGRII